MAATHILFFVGFILAVGIVTVTESTVCSDGGGICYVPNSVCCNTINPGRCCRTGQYCCGREVNFGCCPIGYTCGLTLCTKQARDSIGAAQVPKTFADGNR